MGKARKTNVGNLYIGNIDIIKTVFVLNLQKTPQIDQQIVITSDPIEQCVTYFDILTVGIGSINSVWLDPEIYSGIWNGVKNTELLKLEPGVVITTQRPLQGARLYEMYDVPFADIQADEVSLTEMWLTPRIIERDRMYCIWGSVWFIPKKEYSFTLQDWQHFPFFLPLGELKYKSTNA